MDIATNCDTIRQITFDLLMSNGSSLPNTQVFATILSSSVAGQNVVPVDLGLGADAFMVLMQRHFPGITDQGWLEEAKSLPARCEDERFLEREDLLKLLLTHRADRDQSEQWMASIITDACMGADHLWQDLGLMDRGQLSKLITLNFPTLAEKNDRNMKWKKFLYLQLCIEEGIYVCRSPSCEVCTDFKDCYGPEE